MSEGNIVIVRGHIAGPLDCEAFPIIGEVDAIVVQLERDPEYQPPPAKVSKVRALLSYNVRKGPSTRYMAFDTFIKGHVTEALEEAEDGDNTWVRIGYNQWVARIYNGQTYCEYVD